jgi:hypothetical protein
MQVRDLTTEELKALIRETVTQTIVELLADKGYRKASQKAIVAQKEQVVETETQSASEPKQKPPSQTEQESEHLDIPVREAAKDLGLFIGKE